MKLQKYNIFGSSTSPFVVAAALSSVLTLYSALILLFIIAKLKIVFIITEKDIAPLSTGLISIVLVSFIFIYILAIKSKKDKK